MVQEGRSMALLCAAQGKHQRQWGKKQKHRKLYLKVRKTFSLDGPQALEHIAQGDYGVSILGDIQKPAPTTATSFGLTSLSRQ